MEKEKKPIYKKWWFWLIIVFLVIAIGGSTQNNNSSKTSLTSDTSSNVDTSSATTSATEKKSVYNVGEVYENSYIAIKFVALDDNFKGYNKYAEVKNGCKVIKADFEFENVGSTDFLASAYDFDCYADGYDCEDFWSVDDSGFSSNLSSGKKTKGSVYYQVPIDASEISLEYETNMWSNNKVVFKVK